MKKTIVWKIGSSLLAAILGVASVSMAVGCDEEKNGASHATSQNVSSTSLEAFTCAQDESVLPSGSSIVEESSSAEESQSSEEELQSSEEESSVDFTNVAPSFRVIAENGREVELSDFYGKPIVVNFWATWCPPCKAELPDFQAAYEEYGDEVEFLMVAVLWGEAQSDVTTFLSDNGYSFPVYYDVYGEGVNTYGIEGIPMSLFIDKNGELKYSYNYMITDSVLIGSIQDIL